MRPLNPAYIAVPPERLRKLRPEVVDELAESIQRQGLLQPIVVRRKGTGYTLVAGRHRLEAVLQLELDSVLTVILDGLPAAEAELAEIDENLVRPSCRRSSETFISPAASSSPKNSTPKLSTVVIARVRRRNKIQNENLKAFVEDTAAKTKKSRATVAVRPPAASPWRQFPTPRTQSARRSTRRVRSRRSRTCRPASSNH